MRCSSSLTSTTSCPSTWRMKRQELEFRGLDPAQAALTARRALGKPAAHPRPRARRRDRAVAAERPTGPPLRAADLAQAHGVHRCRDRGARPRHRCQHGHLRRGQRRVADVVPYEDRTGSSTWCRAPADPLRRMVGRRGRLLAWIPRSLLSFRSQSRFLSHVAVFGITSATLTGRGDSIRLDGTAGSPDTFAMHGVPSAPGRPSIGATSWKGPTRW